MHLISIIRRKRVCVCVSVCMQRQCKMPYFLFRTMTSKKRGQWRRHITNYSEWERGGIDEDKTNALNSESEENLYEMYWLEMPFNHLLFQCANWIFQFWLWITIKKPDSMFQWKRTSIIIIYSSWLATGRQMKLIDSLWECFFFLSYVWESTWGKLYKYSSVITSTVNRTISSHHNKLTLI